jgi:hypothetical protein
MLHHFSSNAHRSSFYPVLKQGPPGCTKHLSPYCGMISARNPTRNSLFGRLAGVISAFSGSTMASCGGSGPGRSMGHYWPFLLLYRNLALGHEHSYACSPHLKQRFAGVAPQARRANYRHQGAATSSSTIPDFSAEEIRLLHDFYCTLAAMAKQDNNFGKTTPWTRKTTTTKSWPLTPMMRPAITHRATRQ